MGKGSGFSGDRISGSHLKKGEKIVEIECLARRGRKACKKPFKKIAQPPERAREERKIANREFARQRAPRDIGIGEVIAHRADCGEQPAPACAPHRQPAIGRIEGGGKLQIAVNQESVEAEDFHFLGGFDAGRRLPHVIHFAPLRRAAEIERIALRVEMRLAEEGRHQAPEAARQ